MRVDPEPTLKGAEATLNTLGIHAFVRQDEVMPTPYERPVPPAEARAAERRAARPQLTRPAEGKVIAGVAIGLAHHLGWPVRWIPAGCRPMCRPRSRSRNRRWER